MRWMTFLIAAYLAVCVQFALGVLLPWGEATPNLLLVLVVFVALHAPPRPALAGTLVAGLMHDIVGGHGIGTYALAYPLLASLAGRLRDVMYPDHFATHAAATALLGTLLAVYLEVRCSVRGLFFVDEPAIAFWRTVLGALTSAVAAVPVIGCLRRIRRWFGFSSR